MYIADCVFITEGDSIICNNFDWETARQAVKKLLNRYFMISISLSALIFLHAKLREIINNTDF